MGSHSLSWMEVPITGSDSLNWIGLSVPSFSGQLHATAVVISASHPLTPQSEDAASCFLVGDPPAYMIWRIHSSAPHVLELVEVCPCKEFPRVGLRITFSDALFPFTYIFKDETECASGVLFVLYVLTVSGVVYIVKLRSFDVYVESPIFQLNDIMEFNLEAINLNSRAITSIAAIPEALIIGRSDGTVSCFQLGMAGNIATSMVRELRDDSGLGRLWGFISRGRNVGVEVQDLVVFEFQGRKFACVLHFNGNLCVWDLLDYSKVFSQTLNTSTVTGEIIFTKLWVGETDNETSVVPLAVLLRGTEEISLETMLIYNFHFRLVSKMSYLDPTVHSIPLEVGKLIDVVLTSKNLLVLKESGLRSYTLSHTYGYKGICHLQEATIADQLFQCSDQSSYSSEDLFEIIHSMQSSKKDQVEIASLLSSILLRRLLRVYHKTVMRATFQDYNKHWTDFEFQSLTADDLKNEILLLIEQEGIGGSLTSICHRWKNFCSRYYDIWSKNNAPCGFLVDISNSAVGLIRKDSVSLFRSLDDIEILLINDISVQTLCDFGSSALIFCDLEREILLGVLSCIKSIGYQLGKAAPAIFFESLVASNNMPIGSSEDNIIPYFLEMLENRFSGSSDVCANIPRERILDDHKEMRKFSIDMVLSLHALRKMAVSWMGVFTVIKSFFKNMAPSKTMQKIDSAVNLNVKSSVIVHATSQVAEVMFQSAFNVLLFLSFLIDIGGLIDMSQKDKNHIQVELIPLIYQIMMHWVTIYLFGTTTCESFVVEDFSSQLSSLQIDGQIDNRSWKTGLFLGKCDFLLAFLLNSATSFENPLTCLPNPHSFISSVRSFASCVLWGDGRSDFFSHGTETALLLLRHGQYDAVVYFLIIMDAHSRKKNASGSFESSGKWCTHFHILGCCFLAQAHHKLHGFLKERKLSDAIRCFFRASSGQGALEALQKLSYEIGLPPVLSDNNISGAAWKFQYFQRVMQMFEQFGLYEGAREFGLAALQQVDEAFRAHNDIDNESKIAVKGKLFANIFMYSLDLNSFNDAYWALASNPDEESKDTSLRCLVLALYERGALKTLCDGKSVPFIGMTDRVEQELSLKAESSYIYAKPSMYKLLYSFETHRHDWRKAAYYMYRYTTRLKTQASATDQQTLRERLDGLSSSINALHLVHPPYAWIENPPFDNTHCHYPSKKLKTSFEDVPSSSSSSDIIDIEKLEKEFVLTSAEQLLFTVNVKWSFNGVDKVPSGLVPLLVQMNFLDMAFTVILKFWKDSTMKTQLETVFIALSLKCSHKNSSPNLLPSPSSMTENWFHPITTGRDWETLELYLGKYKHHHPRLPVIVASTLLGMDSQLELPLWLVNMFGGEDDRMTGGEADPASLLRLYVEYGRYTEAASLVVGYMERAGSVRAGDLMRRKSGCAVWFPYTVIERLWREVGECESLKRVLREAVEGHLKVVKVDSEDTIQLLVGRVE